MENTYLQNEIKLIQVEKYLKVVSGILKLAKQCYEYSAYLDTPISEDEFKFIMSSQSFVIFKVISARTAVIELSKLYGKSGNKYNFINFINGLLNGEYGKVFKQHPYLKEWQEKFKKIESTGRKIISLRDKAYAHTDLEHEISALQKVAYEDIKNLILLAEEFIMFMYKTFFNRVIAIKTTQNEFEQNIHLILKAIALNDQ